MKIAVEGCCHGELDKIYETLGRVWEREGVKVDLLICCGDFQAVRNEEDLNCMATPKKYRLMNTFYKYYSGEVVAPVLTLFIGGNHEASNHLWELSYGGWVAPNIYYLGSAGVVRFGGLRIAGLSGIYKGRDYRRGHYECPPYSEDTKRSAYHVRSCDVFRLKQLSGHVDIGLSHDWPEGIYHHGNTEQLLRRKPFFADEISQGCLGSPPTMELLRQLRPDYWFSAHLHVKFPAAFLHEEEGGATRFLALDKCLPRRQFLQILDLAAPSRPPYQLEYDCEWLAILRSTEPLLRYSQAAWLPPHPVTDKRYKFTPTEEELSETNKLFNNDLQVPDNFVRTVTPYDPSKPINHNAVARPRENPQTREFCQKLGIRNPFTPDFHGKMSQSPKFWANPEEIPLDSGSEEEEERMDDSAIVTPPVASRGPRRPYPWLETGSGSSGDEGENTATSSGRGIPFTHLANPDEIQLEDSDDEKEADKEPQMDSAPPTATRESPRGVHRTPLTLPQPTLPPPPSHSHTCAITTPPDKQEKAEMGSSHEDEDSATANPATRPPQEEHESASGPDPDGQPSSTVFHEHCDPSLRPVVEGDGASGGLPPSLKPVVEGDGASGGLPPSLRPVVERDGASGGLVGSPPRPKIRRRNLDIYRSREEEGEDD